MLVNRIKGHQGVYLKKGLVAFTVLFFIFFHLAPQMAFSQQKSAVKEDLLAVSFPTEQDGWACGRWGTVLNTKDGGLSWASQNSGVFYTLTSIKFVDPQKGWAVGDRGTIIHTSDGGKTWVKQASPVDLYLMHVHFANDQMGWIVTEWTTILFTKDGGKTWQKQFKDEDYIFKAVSFCDSKNGWAVGEYGFIYHTADGGQHWKKQVGTFYLSSESFELITGSFLFDVVAIDPMTAWAVGIEGYVTKTIDGGVTWKEQKKIGIPKMHLFGFAHNGQGTFVVGGKGAIYSSQDGGKSFRNCRVEPQVIYDWVYRIVPRGSKGFVTVGKEGRIYLSDKTGGSWKQVENIRR